MTLKEVVHRTIQIYSGDTCGFMKAEGTYVSTNSFALGFWFASSGRENRKAFFCSRV